MSAKAAAPGTSAAGTDLCLPVGLKDVKTRGTALKVRVCRAFASSSSRPGPRMQPWASLAPHECHCRLSGMKTAMRCLPGLRC